LDWKSTLAGYKEVPGTVDPVVFRYPARSSAAAALVAGTVEIVVGLFITGPRFGSFGFWLGICLILGGIVFVALGAWTLVVVRRIEVYPTAERVVDLRQVPLKRRVEKVHEFSHILRISITRSTMEDELGEVVTIELRNGDRVDFGQYSGGRGETVAARLHELTGAPITR
jgi:hypothetical protein